MENVTVVINCLLDQEYRRFRLINLIKKLNFEDITLSVRTRGRFAFRSMEELKNEIDLQVKHTSFYFGDEYQEWRTNTYLQVEEASTDYILFLQEDHALTCDESVFRSCIDEVIKYDVDVWQPSFFFEYYKNREMLAKKKCQDSDLNYIREISIEEWEAIPNGDKNYLISLVGLYKTELAKKFLVSNRPRIREYSSKLPFDFEQPQKEKWFLPIKYSLPRVEIFACIDDDLSIPHSSLIARGLHENDNIRISKYHQKREIKCSNI